MGSPRLEKYGFADAKDFKSLPRLIMSLSGLEKQGKTHFALTAPGPVAVFDTDIGGEGVTEKFTKDKKVLVTKVARITDGDDDAVDDAEEEWDRVKGAYLYLLRGKDVRTIVFDTATEIWELLRIARFGRLTQVMPYQYGPVNKEYRDLIREAYAYDKNLILLHKMKAQYVNDKRTGEYERAGFNDTGFLVQVNAQVYRYSREDGGEFNLSVKDCRQNPELAGEDDLFEGEMCTFPWLANMVLG